MGEGDSLGKVKKLLEKQVWSFSPGLNGVMGSGSKGQKRSGGLGLRLRTLYNRLHMHFLGRRWYLHAGLPPWASGFMMAMDVGFGGHR